MAPRLEIILQHLMYAFGTYQVPMLALPDFNLHTLLNGCNDVELSLNHVKMSNAFHLDFWLEFCAVC